MNFFDKSMTARILRLLVCVVAVLIAIATLIQIFTLQSALTKISHTDFGNSSEIVALQSSGAIKWKKPAILEKTFLSLSKGDNDNLIGMLAIAADGTEILRQQKSAAKPIDFKALGIKLAEHPKILNTYEEKNTLIALTPVQAEGTENGETIGYMALIWDMSDIKSLVTTMITGQILAAFIIILAASFAVFTALRKLVVTPLMLLLTAI